MSNNYDANSLKILKGLDAVRKRPGMYIGATDVSGLHHLIWEIVDNSIDEVLAGIANKIKVILKSDGSVLVEDNGRGIPIDVHKETGMSGVELVFTELHAGGKFGQEGSAYKVSGGLHGVGASVVNALSTKLSVSVYKNGFKYITEFENGIITKKTFQDSPSSKKGTKIQFWPDYSIFKNCKFSFDKVKERLRESSFLIPSLEITVKDEKTSELDVYVAKDGIKEFIEFINEAKTEITSAYSFKSNAKSNIEVVLGFQYTDDYNFNILSFVNNVKTRDGGEHEVGFKNAWTKVINDYAKEQGLLKAKDIALDGEDVREGMTVILSLRVPENILEFVGQTKDKLRTPEAKKAVEDLVERELMFWLQEHKKESHNIINKAISALNARLAARKARNEARTIKKKLGSSKLLSGKLTPAQSKIPLEREIFLVEGDSAGGSAKLGRDRKYQAILPLRGKVINSEKSKLIEILKNEEISTIINTINAGVGNNFDITEAQYGKVIIMTDADTDGAHIQVLLLTFLFRYMRPLIEEGRVFIALPPLYKIFKKVAGKNIEKYAWDDRELRELLNEHKNAEIQRYKGLGEMNADQLWDTTMNPETRTLIKVSIEDAALVERRVSILMGDKVEPRKEWINNNVNFSLEDDFEIIKAGNG